MPRLPRMRVRDNLVITALCILCGIATPAFPQQAAPGGQHFRPPAVPLVTYNPYFSIWSFTDRLTDDCTRHWTGTKQALGSMVRIDGKAFRIMGKDPKTVPAMPQLDLQVFPTRTMYAFQAAGIAIDLTFMTPKLMNDLDVLARPVTYVTWDVRAIDGKPHAISIYFESSAEPVVNTPSQTVVWSRERSGELSVLRMGTEQQPVLAKSGDDLRIDWGYLYAAAPKDGATRQAIAADHAARQAFITDGSLPKSDDQRMPRAANDDSPAMAFTFDLGKVGAKPTARHLILAYDELYSIEYFHQRLRPYWRRNGAGADDLLRKAEDDYPALRARCTAFDEELLQDLRRVGGEKYASLAALAYRQSLATGTLAAGKGGAPLFFIKETSSDGSILCVDVTFPTSPLLLLLNKNLLLAALVPVLEYAESGQWPFVFAPSQLGTYPLANGQTYGWSVEEQRTVEESANMLLMMAAIARTGGAGGVLDQYWPLLTQWANYLRHVGLDPEKQLSTDDFSGTLAHNANLSLKAIEGLGAYALLCDIRGDKQGAAQYRNTAKEFAGQWMKMAADGDHTRLAFDQPGTWSQKYNLVWDSLLGLGLFPPEVARKEVAFYQKKLNRFGFPLDSRKDYTKLDWEIWCATMAESPADFQKLVSPLYDFVNQSPSRVPLTDWYWSTEGKQVEYPPAKGRPFDGFQARPVVGSIFIKMLADGPTWEKWSSRVK